MKRKHSQDYQDGLSLWDKCARVNLTKIKIFLMPLKSS